MSTQFEVRLTEQLATWTSERLLRTKRITEPIGPGQCRIDGRTFWDFSTNDYHGFSRHPEVIGAVCEQIPTLGIGSRASVLISGWSPAHEKLVRTLSEFEQVDDVALFPSGYAACMGTVACLSRKEDVILCDRDLHACLVDGIRISGAKMRVYRRHTLATLERELKKSAGNTGLRWIVTESAFGMEGSVAPLPELVALAEQYDAFLICDEAHATGVYGPAGQGYLRELLEAGQLTHEQIRERIPVRLGTLSKGLGSQGGFVAGSTNLIRVLWNSARSLMFSTGLSVPACVAATAAVKLLTEQPERIHELRSRAQSFRSQLIEQGFAVPGKEDSPIVPILLEDPDRTLRWGAELQAAGYLTGMIRPPTVPQGTSRLRISINSAVPQEAIDQLLHQLICLGRKDAA